MILKLLAVQQTLWIIVACIIHSQTVSPTSFPWVVGIVDNKGISICSGCIVARHMVLTSSACLAKQSKKERDAAKKLIVLAPADNPIILRTVYIILLHPESRADGSLEHGGLVGVHPIFDEREGVQYIAPIWDKNDSSFLHKEYKYVLENAAAMQCYVVAWPYEGTGKIVRKHDKILARDYRIDVVHVVQAHPLLDKECEKHFLPKNFAARTCAMILTDGARLCEYNKGAGLFCSNYLWGIAIGTHSCKKNDSWHEFIRIDAVINFISKQSVQALYKARACQSAENFFPTVVFGILIASFGLRLF